MTRYLLPSFLLLSLSLSSSAQQQTVTGNLNGIPEDAAVYVGAIPLTSNGTDHVRPLSKVRFFESVSNPNTWQPTTGITYQLELTSGTYAIIAFADSNKNGVWDPALAEPIGWYATSPGAMFSPVQIESQGVTKIDVHLQAPHHFPDTSRSCHQSQFRHVHGYPVLELKGDAGERGYAHGNLIAPQIVDFFRFYILEDKFRSAAAYENGFAKFLESHFNFPDAFVTECEALIRGMQDSDADLFIPELGRDFSLVDLYAINGYIETRAMRSSCTQFAAWGARTTGTDVAGGMITGRNMDGEVDVRKVTVSHFLLIAVDPDEQAQKRFVSMMWPGFVATISGFNEDGFYAMENAGLTQPGGVVDQLVPFSWTMRETLTRLGANTTETEVMEIVNRYDNAAGGSCGPGCVTLFAMPFTNQPHPAFVIEGDRFGEAIRRAQDVEPRIPQVLLASNHHRVYGVDDDRSNQVFGREVGFSSRWRYEAGAQKVAAWYRTGKSIGTQEMQELLQTVAHGTTEYAVITRPNQRQFDVAVASMKAELWDAPYRTWTTFQFDEVFSSEPAAREKPRQ